LDGDRDVLGMWFQETEGAKFWMQVLNDLRQRGVRDILIACVEGLTGFPEAIEAIFPATTVQTCIVHLIRSSLKYVPRREREEVARDLKPIYTAIDAEHAQAQLASRSPPPRPARSTHAPSSATCEANASATSRSTPQLRAAIAGWLAGRADWPGANDSPALFLNQRGRCLNVRGAHDIITGIAAGADLDDDTTVHTTCDTRSRRRSCAAAPTS
jgi:hypothetical protein